MQESRIIDAVYTYVGNLYIKVNLSICMKDRYTDRRLYFDELVQTSSEFLSKYISGFFGKRQLELVLEIGCGEGGNLVPFAQMGCGVCGIDVSEKKIRHAVQFFSEDGLSGHFICSDFLQMDLSDHVGMYDLIIIHDVIEHIEPESKIEFMVKAGRLLKKGGLLMVAFPAWKMPFGGHQQICRRRLCRIPFIHLLPSGIYKGYLILLGENQETIKELSSIRRAAMSIESFEKLCESAGMTLLDRRLWLINPHYKVKFGLRPRELRKCLCKSRWLRNHMSSSCFYMLSCKEYDDKIV